MSKQANYSKNYYFLFWNRSSKGKCRLWFSEQ